MLPNFWKFPNRILQTFGFVYHYTNGQHHGPVWKTPSFLLSRISSVILWQDCYGKGNLRTSYWKHGWEKVSNWGCLFVHREKRIFIFCECGWHQIGCKETKYKSDVQSTKQRLWYGRTNIFPRSCVLGMYSKTMWNKQRRNCWEL